MDVRLLTGVSEVSGSYRVIVVPRYSREYRRRNDGVIREPRFLQRRLAYLERRNGDACLTTCAKMSTNEDEGQAAQGKFI